MAEEKSSALEAIADSISGLPAPVETSFFKAVSHLIGSATAIPAAWLKRPAQAINDVTAARSTVSAVLAKGVAESALNDPAIMQLAMEIYLPSAVRKARNRVQIAQKAAEYTVDQVGKTNSSEAAPPDDDWMNKFMRLADDASSEQLQNLFARILAGEVMRNGSFSLSTLRTVSELDKSTAEDFSLVWSKSVGGAVDYNEEFARGEWFSRWKRMAEAGLMAQTKINQFLPPYRPVYNGDALWSPMSAGTTLLRVHFSQECNASWQCIEFTRIGRELGSILEEPDYPANIRIAARKLSGKVGIKRIEMITRGLQIEVIA
ncbi:DUF2806 domain-containing protein [Thalassobaculum sp. OXR-137]|uniref:DUF2806 domain-containing protein n=1 Tax=Thalassobaculum sp. OXR-137 TaxID=3100173 RepID=UPI002AC9A6EC|nr:DUF2806 domain-containing protein [Thalassobaculum sp. OXR-137]WPZ35179.1 DUF2806 domain-containing protein [Thalassobaculum sp. OXR-137]